jgi:thiamine pyrophosphokinase
VETVCVFDGGEGSPRLSVPPAATVIAADGGAVHALALGLHVDLAVGDFDSITPGALAALEEAGTRIERHPVAKDKTDLELALDAALVFAPGRLLVIGGGGGRLDHLLGGLLLLAADAYAGVQVDAQLGAAAVHVIRGERTLPGEPGELISLFAVHGAASGVVTDGLVYPLRGETLEPGTSRGISNVFGAPDVRIALERGVLLAVRPSGTVRVES